MRGFGKLKLGVVLVLFLFMSLMIWMLPNWKGVGYRENGSEVIFNKRNFTHSAVHRKLLSRTLLAMEEPDRVWGEKCSRGDILINQGPSEPLPSGIPAFTVEIVNRCGSGCNISGIHLSCGWFSSDHIINPKIFKRLRYNDCLVNDGKSLINGGTLTFNYANTFAYPLSVSSIVCS